MFQRSLNSPKANQKLSSSLKQQLSLVKQEMKFQMKKQKWVTRNQQTRKDSLDRLQPKSNLNRLPSQKEVQLLQTQRQLTNESPEFNLKI